MIVSACDMKSETSFDSDGDLNEESENNHEGLEFVQCNFCGKAFIIKVDLDAETGSKSKKGIYSCNQCSKEPVSLEEQGSEPDNFMLKTDKKDQSQGICPSNESMSDSDGQSSDAVATSISPDIMSQKEQSLIQDDNSIDDPVLSKENLTSQSELDGSQPIEYVNDYVDNASCNIVPKDKPSAHGTSSGESNNEMRDAVYDSNTDNRVTENVPCSSNVYIAMAPHFKSLRASNMYNSDTMDYIKALEEYNTSYQERNENGNHSSVADGNKTDSAPGSYDDNMPNVNNDQLPMSSSLDDSFCDSLGDQNPHSDGNSFVTMSASRQFKKRRSRANVGEKEYETSVRREEAGTGHECTYCGVPFSDRATLIEHTKQHTGETDDMCIICNKVIKKHYELKIHVRGHTGHKPFKCSICSVRFLKYSQLTKHGRIHSGEKPFKCKICLKDFPRGDNLRKHLRTHSGERPYKCTYCPWEFAEHGQLRKHIRIHTGEKPFKCTLCPKAFPRKENLQKHTRTHTGEKPFKCTFCEWKFAECSHLIRHTNRAHLGIKDDRKKPVMNYATRMNFKIQRMNYQRGHGPTASTVEKSSLPAEADVVLSENLPVNICDA